MMGLFDFREQVSAWTHCIWLFLSLPATVILWRRCGGNRAKQLSVLVYGISLALCYAGSTLYHGARLPEDLVEGICARLDYMGVYLLIAGTVTPAAVVLLRGWWRLGTLIGAWMLAGTGILLRVLPLDLSRSVSTALYLAMGWGVLFCYFELVRSLSHRAMRLAPIGGLLYSVGAILNWIHWPVLWPGVFSTHEFFHLFVMAGSVCHYFLMLNVIVPFEPPVV